MKKIKKTVAIVAACVMIVSSGLMVSSHAHNPVDNERRCTNHHIYSDASGKFFCIYDVVAKCYCGVLLHTISTGNRDAYH